jgi:hypothetical protein
MATHGPTVTPVEVIDWTIQHALGRSAADIAATTGRGTQTIRRHLDEAGVYQPKPGRHITAEQRAAIVARYQAGGTVKSVAADGNHTQATVLRVLHSARVQIRPCGQPGAVEDAEIRAAQNHDHTA